MAEASAAATKKAASTIRGKGQKRQHPAVYNGEESSFEERSGGILCPVCFNLIDSAYMTECGHSFCFKCIQNSLELQNRCPKCNYTTKPDKIFPNFTLNEVILQKKQKMNQMSKLKDLSPHLYEDTEDMAQDVLQNKKSSSINHLDMLIDLLKQKKKHLQFESELGQTSLILEFLQQIQDEKNDQLKKLKHEMKVIEKDIMHIKHKAASLENTESGKSCPNGSDEANSKLRRTSSFGSLQPVTRQSNGGIRQKFNEHSSDLQKFYFSKRNKAMVSSDADYDEEGLNDFTQALAKFVKYSSFQPLATLNYTSDMYNMYSIVSSIEFDKDADYFAIAGVTKRIKIYDYSQVICDVVDMHYPISEMVCTSKISCVAWNPYHKNELASSDYEGTVTVWDPFVASKTQIFQEHEKRCWCVDYCRMNPLLLASGSDDSKVKIWSTDMNRSVMNIEAKANVCCVKFNPASTYHLAFGSADHCVHYYDLRNPREPIVTFKGHLKAVSYAKFLNGEEIVSASTDSQLKLWNVNKGTCAMRTFQGHINEKNFVGLASDSDYVACGSEDNSLCIYYKGLTQMILKYKFDIVRSAWQRDAARDEDSNEFVSAVCWKPDSNVVVVANSQGIIKVLELI